MGSQSDLWGHAICRRGGAIATALRHSTPFQHSPLLNLYNLFCRIGRFEVDQRGEWRGPCAILMTSWSRTDPELLVPAIRRVAYKLRLFRNLVLSLNRASRVVMLNNIETPLCQQVYRWHRYYADMGPNSFISASFYALNSIFSLGYHGNPCQLTRAIVRIGGSWHHRR